MSTLLRSLVALLVVAGLGVACATAQKPSEATSTIEVISEADAGAPGSPLVPLATAQGFALMMPPGAEPRSQTVKIPAGDVQVSSWSATDESGVNYSVTTADYPPALVSKSSADVFLSEARQSVLQQLPNAKVVSEETVALQGYPGTTYVVQSDRGEVRGRHYLVGNRLYTMLVVYNPAIGAPHAGAFFDSLQFINPPPPIARPPAGAPADAGT
ncbi:MAG: hypothetical protein L0Y66_03245 [Myxococcaceae bacterium]|nr:hypothetical protein [Myxococcaceae bacterium]MCI0672782.1 hypothetical protein [Myxococcaceae bacterium]